MTAPVNHSMKLQVIMMTPEWARELLKKNHPRNRRLKDSKISAYARDMMQGFWRLTHQAIAVDVDGFLVDGQNRLEAVVMSETDVPMCLITGAPRDSILGADLGANRNVGDMAHIQGKDMPRSGNDCAGVARRMMLGLRSHPYPTNAEVLAFVEEHRAALEFAYECFPKAIRGITHAPVKAVIARAYYRRNNRNRTREFCEVLCSGLPESARDDSAALRLRNWLQDTFLGGKRGSGKRAASQIVYAKTERALMAFHAREFVQIVTELKRELFPIPEDADYEEQEQEQEQEQEA